MADISALMMDDHAWFRYQFARFDDAQTQEEQGRVWAALAARLEIHAAAEEALFYPALLREGGGDAVGETKDAVRDHNKIRAGIKAASVEEVGSPKWHKAVSHARAENSEHMTEEEDEGFPDFRKHASAELREKLGGEWQKFYAEHPDPSVLPEKVEVREVIERVKNDETNL